MRLSNRTKTAINVVLLSISFITWILLLLNPGQLMTVGHCHVSDSGASAASLSMLLEMNPFHTLLVGWLLMVVAMMLPKLIIPIQQIYSKSFKHIRFPSSLLFVFGYITIWTIVGVFMISLILGFHLVMPNSYLPAIGLGITAIIWQFSPLKQLFLNRGHNHWTLSAFGFRAYKDAFLYGMMHGVWCVGAGWALMLFPMVLPYGHNFAMIIVTSIMISEHLEHPQRPSWNLNLRPKLLFFVISQIKIRK
ncbi:DUF2182 domain-containing protein [Flavobacterium sp. 7A]|uniref:DUF2182 domain-containing protein n=1 Tax=Flavobacterium sp. 7A TaxID=2940571 RepID=UPI002226C4A3|nr:DUF2182 domain-containing protein [Flavobacterium sp. 7A]MCW2118636.1 putative metal-binding membrane protein [Flavobacterium sp. 7A]